MKRRVSSGLLDYFSKKSRNEDSGSASESATSIVNSSSCGSSSLSTSSTSTDGHDSSSNTASGLSTINRFPNDPANGRLPRDQIKILGPCQPTDFHFPTTRYSDICLASY